MHPGGHGLPTDFEGIVLDDDFYQYRFKVERCMSYAGHIWRNCPFVHAGEPVQRRHPSRHLPDVCPLIKQGRMCPDGPERCRYAHNSFEAWLHPERFKTLLCRKGAKCNRSICFFAHSEAELRAPTKAKAPLSMASLAVPDAHCQVSPGVPVVTTDACVGVTSCGMFASLYEHPYGLGPAALGVPDLQVSLGVPDLQVPLGVPDLQLPLAYSAPAVSLGLTPDLQQLMLLSVGGSEVSLVQPFSISVPGKGKAHAVNSSANSSSSPGSATSDVVLHVSATAATDSSFGAANVCDGNISSIGSSSSSSVLGVGTPWSSPAAAAMQAGSTPLAAAWSSRVGAAETAQAQRAAAAGQQQPQAVHSISELLSLAQQQQQQQQQAMQLLQQRSNALTDLLAQQQQQQQHRLWQQQLHAQQLQEQMACLHALQLSKATTSSAQAANMQATAAAPNAAAAAASTITKGLAAAAAMAPSAADIQLLYNLQHLGLSTPCAARATAAAVWQ